MEKSILNIPLTESIKPKCCYPLRRYFFGIMLTYPEFYEHSTIPTNLNFNILEV